jgi:hypothetical protein
MICDRSRGFVGYGALSFACFLSRLRLEISETSSKIRESKYSFRYNARVEEGAKCVDVVEDKATEYLKKIEDHVSVAKPNAVIDFIWRFDSGSAGAVHE